MRPNPGITIKLERRPCLIDGFKKAVFHCWGFCQDHDIGGIVDKTVAIVELEDGQVIYCEPHRIRFVGSDVKEYSYPNESASTAWDDIEDGSVPEGKDDDEGARKDEV